MRENESMKSGPDFMCVGMVKGGTRWLFDQLQYHPDFWMPPIKELHYFDRGLKRGKNARQALKFARGESDRRKKQSNRSRAPGPRDLAFLEEMSSHNNQPLNVQAYGRLFRHKGDLKSGDITPHYCALEDEVIVEISQQFPDIRIILLVRDPVKRAWSHISMASRGGGFDDNLLRDPDQFRQFLASDKQLNRLSYASRAAANWLKYVDEKRFRYFFMDDIAANAADTRKEMLLFLDADPDKPSGTIPPDHNPKAKSKKLDMSPAIQEALAEHFADELNACATTFGGHANSWRAAYLA
ncbi:MAG: sulfotransferase [Rhizomicrobium sp.]